jgi:hypothetical protein
MIMDLENLRDLTNDLNPGRSEIRARQREWAARAWYDYLNHVEWLVGVQMNDKTPLPESITIDSSKMPPSDWDSKKDMPRLVNSFAWKVACGGTNHNTSEADKAFSRDSQRCVFTHDVDVGVMHILPVSLNSTDESTKRVQTCLRQVRALFGEGVTDRWGYLVGSKPLPTGEDLPPASWEISNPAVSSDTEKDEERKSDKKDVKDQPRYAVFDKPWNMLTLDRRLCEQYDQGQLYLDVVPDPNGSNGNSQKRTRVTLNKLPQSTLSKFFLPNVQEQGRARV